MKEKPINFSTEMVKAILAGRKTQTRRVIKPQPDEDGGIDACNNVFDDNTPYCPYQIGQTLWVRETWKMSTGVLINGKSVLIYKADCDKETSEKITHWKSSIFMPRQVARIFIKAINVRVERIQDISQKDINKEGLWHYSSEYRQEICKWRDCVSAIHQIRKKYFKKLWDSLNKKRDFGWDENPWVWVIEFERIMNE